VQAAHSNSVRVDVVLLAVAAAGTEVLVDIHTTAVGYSRISRWHCAVAAAVAAELSTRGACAAVRRARVRYDIRLFDPKHRICDIRCYLGRIRIPYILCVPACPSCQHRSTNVRNHRVCY